MRDHRAALIKWSPEVRKEQEMLKATQGDFYRVIHRAADKMRPTIRRKFLASIKRVRSNTSLAALADAIQRGRMDEIRAALSLDATMKPALEANIIAPLHQIVAVAGGYAARVLPGKQFASLRGRFDMLNPHTVAFINQYDFDLVTGVTRRTEEGLRSVLRDAFEYGGHPREQAEYIKTVVGLTPRQAGAVARLRRQLAAAGHSKSFIRARVKSYADRLLHHRATNIARTETIRAANVGQESLWGQAADEGLLDTRKTRRIWIVTKDDLLCPYCKAMPQLNKNGVGLDEPFKSDFFNDVEGPPLHPQCRCSQGLRL